MKSRNESQVSLCNKCNTTEGFPSLYIYIYIYILYYIIYGVQMNSSTSLLMFEQIYYVTRALCRSKLLPVTHVLVDT